MELFDYLVSSSKYDISRYVNEIEVVKGEQIYIPGQATFCMYEIMSGAIKLGSYGSQGQEVTYDVISAPDTFGNLKYLNGKFFEFAESIANSRLRTYQLDFFKTIIVEDPVISEWFNITTVRRWSQAESRLFHIRSQDRVEKVQSVFNEFNKGIKDASGRAQNLFSLLTMNDLGDLTGMTRQTVSQVLKKIQRDDRKETAQTVSSISV